MAAMMIMPDEQRCVLNDSLALSRLELSTGHADLFRIFALILHASYSHGAHYPSLFNRHASDSVARTQAPMQRAGVCVCAGMLCPSIGRRSTETKLCNTCMTHFCVSIHANARTHAQVKRMHGNATTLYFSTVQQ